MIATTSAFVKPEATQNQRYTRTASLPQLPSHANDRCGRHDFFARRQCRNPCYDLGINRYLVEPLDSQRFFDGAQDVGLDWMLLHKQPLLLSSAVTLWLSASSERFKPV